MLEEAISRSRNTNSHEQAAKLALQHAIELKKTRDLQERRESAGKWSAGAERIAREANAARLNALLAAAQEHSRNKEGEFDEPDRVNTLNERRLDLLPHCTQKIDFAEDVTSPAVVIGGRSLSSATEPEALAPYKSLAVFGRKLNLRLAFTVIFVAVGIGLYLHVGEGRNLKGPEIHNAPKTVALPEEFSAGRVARSELAHSPESRPGITIDPQTAVSSISAPASAVKTVEKTISEAAHAAASKSVSNPQQVAPAARAEPLSIPASASDRERLSMVRSDEPTAPPTTSDAPTNPSFRQAAMPKATLSRVTRSADARRRNVTAPPVPGLNPFRTVKPKAAPPPPPNNWPANDDIE